jgi:hypothetical protein
MKKALVLSLICVLGFTFAGMAASLSGEWDTEVTIKPLGTWGVDALTLTSDITVIYTVGDWAFTSMTGLTEAGWASQSFGAAGVLGAFSLSSDLDLDPAVGFIGWTTTGAVSIAGVSFSMEFELDGTDAYLTLGGSGVAGDVTVAVEVTFGDDITAGCDLPFSGVTIDVGFPFCCADMALALVFDCTGFVSACFSTGAIAIPNIPWLTIDAEVCFDLIDGKTVTLTPGFSFGDIVCFDIDLDFAESGGVMAPLLIGDIVISGIGLTCDIGAVTFTGYTDFLAVGGEDYFEWYTISTNDDGCCGPFGFELGIYFLDGGLMLFDVGLIDADMTLQIASQFLFTMGLEIDVDAGAFSLWTVGFEVTW